MHENSPRKSPPKSDFADRLLTIFETIAAHGPISANELALRTDIPKVSAWRGAKILQDRGWIRPRISDGWFQVSSKFDDILADVVIPPPEVDGVSEILDLFRDAPPVAVAVGIFWSYGYYKEIECNRANENYGHKLSLVDDFQTTAALFLCSENEIARHLRSYARHCPENERKFIESGVRMDEILLQARQGPFVWDDGASQFAFPWLFRSGVRGAVRVFTHRSRGTGDIVKAAKILSDINVQQRWRHILSASGTILGD